LKLKSAIWCVLLLGACTKNQSVVQNQTPLDMDLSAIIQSDDYFRMKRKNGNTGADSISKKTLFFKDINGDAIDDTIVIAYNVLNSRYNIHFSCYPDNITLENINEIQIKDISDLNGDKFHEMLLFIQSEESCWDEIKLYSWNQHWVEKYSGLTYQCTENTNQNYQFRKLDEHKVLLTTYGINKDSIDAVLGDTLENIIPNALNTHVITW